MSSRDNVVECGSDRWKHVVAITEIDLLLQPVQASVGATSSNERSCHVSERVHNRPRLHAGLGIEWTGVLAA